ncbi:CidA/LrgA family protein [Paenibacillus sp. strain BS8-2]
MAGLAWLIGFLLVGELIEHVLHVPFPANVTGMALLLLSLRCGWIRLEQVEATANFFLSHMLLFFVPTIVGTMVFLPVIMEHPWAIGAALTIVTLASMAATGWTIQAAESRAGKNASRRIRTDD